MQPCDLAQVMETGAVQQLRTGDHAVTSAVTSCGLCTACRIKRAPSLSSLEAECWAMLLRALRHAPACAINGCA